MEAVKLSVFDNKWSEIYDFTPADANWSFLPITTKVARPALTRRCWGVR